jgi:hypothetical protein
MNDKLFNCILNVFYLNKKSCSSGFRRIKRGNFMGSCEKL